MKFGRSVFYLVAWMLTMLSGTNGWAFTGHKVTLEWDPVTDAGLSGYILYWGTTSGIHNQSQNVSKQTSGTVSNLTEGITYYFVVTAYNSYGLESEPSNEVSWTPKAGPPTAETLNLSALEDTPVAINLTGQSPTGSSLTYTITKTPLKGALEGTAPALTYVPKTNLFGTDTFAYVVSDGTSTSAEATVTVVLEPVDDPPVAMEDNVTANFNTTSRISPAKLLRNDLEFDGEPLQIVSVSPKSLFDASVILSEGLIYYTPPIGFDGDDEFEYTIADSHGRQSTARVQVLLQEITTKPARSASKVQVEFDGAVTAAFQGLPGFTYAVEASTNLTTWAKIGVAVAQNDGSVIFKDAEAAKYSTRYYRITVP